MTTITHNAGGDVAVDLAFYGPPGAGGALGSPFDLTGWEFEIYNPSAQLLDKETIEYTDRAAGKVRVIFEGTSDLGQGTETFRVQLVRAAGPTDNGFSVGFPITRINIGDFNTADFDTEPLVQQLSGKNGIQMTIAPAEPNIIYGDAPAPAPGGVTIDSNAITIDSNAITIDAEAA